jgi:class 3 adenylate cyclase
LAVDNFAAIPKNVNWLTAVGLLADVCALLRDERNAATLYELLLPYAGRCIVVGVAFSCLGPASRQLGNLAALIGRWEEAERHFEDALAMNTRMGARPFAALTQQWYADMLMRRDGPGDREKALSLVSQALDAAQALGMKALLERALALKLKAQGVDLTDTGASIDAVASLVYAEKPDLRRHAAPDGTVTILFSDIEGSTEKTDRLGDKAWMNVLREHNAIVREQIKAHNGFEVKSEGDGFMLAFQSARKALDCAIAIQQALHTRNSQLAVNSQLSTLNSQLGRAHPRPHRPTRRGGDQRGRRLLR